MRVEDLHLDRCPGPFRDGHIKKKYIKPTYNEQDFTLAKPLADETFPLLQSFVDKWLCPGVPVCIQDEFKAAMVTHNTKHNPSHKTWSSQDFEATRCDTSGGA